MDIRVTEASQPLPLYVGTSAWEASIVAAEHAGENGQRVVVWVDRHWRCAVHPSGTVEDDQGRRRACLWSDVPGVVRGEIERVTS